ncbi:MAG: hypothetical protein ACTS2F_01195 [Thainema sp.]
MRQQQAILISSIVFLSFCTSCNSRSPEATANAQVGDSDSADSADIVAQSAQPPTAPQDFSPAATSTQSSGYPVAQAERSANTSFYWENFLCETATYEIEILGSAAQPSMVVRSRNSGVVLNSPADVLREKDDSLVFTSLRGEATYYVTVYPNTNTCNLQIMGASGSETVSESGRLVPRGGPDDTNLDAYRLGYQQGFKSGYESGFNYRKYKYGYYPDSAYRRPSYGDEGYAKGHRDGFYAGFHQGYYSVVEGMW